MIPSIVLGSKSSSEPQYPFAVRYWETASPDVSCELDFRLEADLNEFVTSLTLLAPKFGWEVIARSQPPQEPVK